MGIHDDDHGPTSYNVSGKIMVTAIISLSFVVLLVTLLHIYVRCVLRRQARRRTSLWQIGLFTTAPEPPKTGLDETVLGSLPTFVFKQDHKARTIECTVCLSNFEDGEIIRILPNCKHNFHVACIDTWLSANSTCPVCRTEVEPPQDVAQANEPGIDVPQPTAPPLDDEIQQGTAIGSSSRLSSFRKMLSRDRSSPRIHAGLDDDLERQ
ncbi:E3 ubiquitin-protein ligase EL5 [Heracleum sosnowskyi]|uniref:RING-type E3 ubiquitin transferase n=1 Tax=Heracleum sosnowskyi TaxID=360622 RepID=A0AAD8N2G1_9APIA|nr:E3 ubiquitin-protein ligase EL5 [Heracleum sosnowskyi]